MRGIGLTTAQMQSAPKNSVFVWVNEFLDYPRELAGFIGRGDLEIVGPSWLTSDHWRGRIFSGLVKDHACRLSEEEWEAWDYLRPLVRLKG